RIPVWRHAPGDRWRADPVGAEPGLQAELFCFVGRRRRGLSEHGGREAAHSRARSTGTAASAVRIVRIGRHAKNLEADLAAAGGKALSSRQAGIVPKLYAIGMRRSGVSDWTVLLPAR